MSLRLASIITPLLATIGVVGGIALVWQLRGLVMLFFISLILASAFRPMVVWASKRHVPQPITIATLYILVLVVLGVFFSVVIPPLVGETALLITRLSALVGVGEFQLDGFAKLDLGTVATSFRDYNSVISQVTGSITTLLSIVFSTFSFFFVFATTLVLTFYLLLSFDELAGSFAWLLPGSKKEQVTQAYLLLHKVQDQLGSWVRGELTLMFVIGLMTQVGLFLLGIPYALPLAILAGLLEILPNLGPTIAAIPAVLVAFFLVSPWAGLAVLLLSILVQQLENNFIVPKIMRDAVDVKPVTTILLMLAGFRLLGVMGALLVIPFYITVRSIVKELWPDKGPFVDYSKLL